MAAPLLGVSTSPALANNGGDPLFCQPQEGIGFLITNSGSDVWTVDPDCFGNFLPSVPTTLTSQSTITTSAGGRLTLTVTPSGGNYVYTPPSASFVGVDTFDFTVTSEWNGAGGSGSGSPNNNSRPGGPYTFTGSYAIQLNVLNATSTLTAQKNTAIAVPVPVGSISGCGNLGNPGSGPPAGAVTGCTTAVSDLPPQGTPLSQQPLHGRLTRSGATGLTYTPNAGYYGSDTFSYYALGVNTDGDRALASGQIFDTVSVMTNIDTLNPSYNASLLATFLNPTFTGGTLALDQPGATYSQAFTLDASRTNTIDQTGHAATFTGVFSDATTAGNLTIANSGVGGSVTFAAANTYTGSTTINAGATLKLSTTGSIATSSGLTDNGTFDVSAGGASLKSLDGTGTVALGSQTLTLTNASGTFGGGIAGTGGLAITGGVETLNGTNLYFGQTFISGGTLIVNGSITSPVMIASGMLSGTGVVSDVIVGAGGVLAPGSATPGSSLTIAGNLAIGGGSYLVTLGSAGATFADVAGSATLTGGTVVPFFSGTDFRRQYDILHAASLNGTTFLGLSSATLGTQLSGTLSYSGTDVFLNLTAQLGTGGGLSSNEQNVASAINGFFNSGGALPQNFTALFGFSGAALGANLNQLTGEAATASQQTTFQAMTQFMGLLTDPFMGRGNGINAMTGTPGYADDGASSYAATKRNAAERDAYAMFTKARPASFEQRWSVWASGFGGTQTTDGNAVVGANTTTSSIFGTAVGADYLFSPNTLAGFALAGGGTGFNVAGSGWGRSDLFQAGAYLRHNDGPAYVSAALAYGWQDVTTNRIVRVAGLDRLQAEFNANAYSGRLEGGYRFIAPWNGGLGITPYAAAQFTTFDLPAYAETATQGSGAFALAYAAKTVTDTRSELGVRTDKSYAMLNGVLTLRGRLAWAHDFNTDRSIASTFQALPGASFVVNGAMQAADSALTTASAEMKWLNGWSAGATFEGEFSSVTRSYAGKGVVRYQW